MKLTIRYHFSGPDTDRSLLYLWSVKHNKMYPIIAQTHITKHNTCTSVCPMKDTFIIRAALRERVPNVQSHWYDTNLKTNPPQKNPKKKKFQKKKIK